jgi:hypothetical protein
LRYIGKPGSLRLNKLNDAMRQLRVVAISTPPDWGDGTIVGDPAARVIPHKGALFLRAFGLRTLTHRCLGLITQQRRACWRGARWLGLCLTRLHFASRLSLKQCSQPCPALRRKLSTSTPSHLRQPKQNGPGFAPMAVSWSS